MNSQEDSNVIEEVMTEINFTKIRAFDGSQNSGFEELVCQLAHLEKPANAKRFVEKKAQAGTPVSSATGFLMMIVKFAGRPSTSWVK